MLKKAVYILSIGLVLYFIGSGFKLLSSDVFGFHDITQASRIADFVRSLQLSHIPPRVAPTFSFGMGYPIFNHYAPFAYWVTALIHLAGFSVPMALKLSFFIACIVAGAGMYAFLKEYFHEYAALLGGIVYATSPYIALEIFVRGNLAEMWFIALLPCVLYCVHKVQNSSRHVYVIALAVTYSFLLTSHNALSIVGGGFVLLYALLFKDRKIFSALIIGGMLAAYFLMPALLELDLTHAKNVATETVYAEHFVCPMQLWNSPLGYGGSTPGCSDGMSFQIGKILLLLGLGGFALYLYVHMKKLLKDKKFSSLNVHVLSIAFVTVASLFLILKESAPIWLMFEDFLSLFQFPWRFMVFVVFGFSFFAAYLISIFKNTSYLWVMVLTLIVGTTIFNAEFFVANPDKTWAQQDFENEYMSQEYIRNSVAYRVPEYVPKTVDFEYWKTVDGTEISSDPITTLDGELIIVLNENPYAFEVATSSESFLVNKHYSPFWKIMINNEEVIPSEFDQLGRPVIQSSAEKSIVEVYFEKTQLQKFAEVITLAGVLLLVLPYLQSWTKKH